MCVVVMTWWVGWGQGWSWCLVSMRDKARWLVVCRSISSVCGEYTDYTRSHHHTGAQFWEGSSRNWSVFLERSSTGRNVKAPVRCPYSRLAALHGAPRTRVYCWMVLRDCCTKFWSCCRSCLLGLMCWILFWMLLCVQYFLINNSPLMVICFFLCYSMSPLCFFQCCLRWFFYYDY